MSSFKQGFQLVMGGLCALWFVRFVGGVLALLVFIGFATGWIFVPFAWLRSCISTNGPQFVQDCAIDRLEASPVTGLAVVACKDGARYELGEIPPPHGQNVKIYRFKGKYFLAPK